MIVGVPIGIGIVDRREKAKTGAQALPKRKSRWVVTVVVYREAGARRSMSSFDKSDECDLVAFKWIPRRQGKPDKDDASFAARFRLARSRQRLGVPVYLARSSGDLFSMPLAVWRECDGLLREVRRGDTH